MTAVDAYGKIWSMLAHNAGQLDPALVACTCLDRRSTAENPQLCPTGITDLQFNMFTQLISCFRSPEINARLKAAWTAMQWTTEASNPVQNFLAADRTCDNDSLLESSAKRLINSRVDTSTTFHALWFLTKRSLWRWGAERSRLRWGAAFRSLHSIHELNLDLISSTMSWSVPSRGSSCLLHHANLLHEASRSHGRVIYHLPPPLIKRPPCRHQRSATCGSTLIRGNTGLCDRHIRLSQGHSFVWIHHLLDRVLTSDRLHTGSESICWLNSRSTCDWRQNCRSLLLCTIMCLDSKCFLLDDRLLFPEQGTLTDQVKVVGIGLHSDSRDARSSPFLILSFHLCSPMGVNTGELRQMKSLIRALHTSQMLSAPTGILDQGRPWHTADHQPRWWNCTGAASHIQPISSAVEAKLQPIGILTKCIRWWSCHEPQLHMTKGVVERHHDTTFWNGIDPATHFPGDGTDPPSLKHCDHERGYERRLLQGATRSCRTRGWSGLSCHRLSDSHEVPNERAADLPFWPSHRPTWGCRSSWSAIWTAEKPRAIALPLSLSPSDRMELNHTRS